MDRRAFLTTTAAGAAGAASLAAPAIAQDRKVAKMVTPWPKNFPGLGTGAQRLADRITSLSEGRIEVQLFAAGELVPAFESFDAVSSGAAEMYHAPDYYWQGKHAAFNFFSGVPMGLTCQELNSWIRYGGGQELWDELAGEFGVKCEMVGNTGAQMGGWFREPVTSLDDMKGLKIRMPGLGGEVMRQIGASAVSLPGGEIFPALQSGAIDAVEWVGPYNDLAFGFYKVLKNYMYPGWQEGGSGISLGMNLAWWESLSETEQQLIRTCCAAELDIMLSEFNFQNAMALNTLLTEHGVQLHAYPGEVLAELAAASEDVVAQVGSGDELGERVYASFSNFRKLISEWSKLSEQGYLDARSSSLQL
ncbi:TRAP transporter substrate-binding protein [Amaricoccus macauensis]|uniref:TRAP transporter substrate-binding protein n=1 Tax=Amaricoccus macauensis TaxID=57001 RepID=UPI003C7D0115